MEKVVPLPKVLARSRNPSWLLTMLMRVERPRPVPLPTSYVLLKATDTGSGIPPEILHRIFEPFFTTKEVGKGTGLGLSTLISIVKSHQGFLDLASTVGKGTTFSIYFPASQVTALAAPEAPRLETLRGHGECILVVDDEAAIRDMAQAALTLHGYEVVTAKNGSEAISACVQHPEKFAVILMDMMMPVMSGTLAIRALKRKYPRLLFICMSGLIDRKSTRLNSSHLRLSRMPSSA